MSRVLHVSPDGEKRNETATGRVERRVQSGREYVMAMNATPTDVRVRDRLSSSRCSDDKLVVC
jgi:hypothetical protein